MTADKGFRWIAEPTEMDSALARALTTCWTRVSNAGGAVGFPFLPVKEVEVSRAVAEMVASLGDYQHLLLSTIDGELAGWLLLGRNSSPLVSHWGHVTRVQTDLPFRGRGLGVALMIEAARAGREDLALEQLHIGVRGGAGLEDFYSRLGWREIGRWPAALRLNDDDYRDDVLMVLSLIDYEA